MKCSLSVNQIVWTKNIQVKVGKEKEEMKKEEKGRSLDNRLLMTISS